MSATGPDDFLTRSADLAREHGEIATPSAHLIPDVLYHYTDASGLLGMLRGRSIWLSDHRYLNDKSEITHSDAILRKVVTSEVEDCTSSACLALYAKLLAGPSTARLRPIYIFSLSEDRDSLSQWRAYARDGKGFTIGFDAEKLLDSRRFWDDGFNLRRVEYDQRIQERGLEKLCPLFLTSSKRPTPTQTTLQKSLTMLTPSLTWLFFLSLAPTNTLLLQVSGNGAWSE